MRICFARARDIIAEWINENIYVRKQLRRFIKELLLSAPVKKQKRRKSTKNSINISIGQNH
jgi:hypothetical protein